MLSNTTRSKLKHCYNFQAITKDLFTPRGFKSLDGLRAMFMMWIVVFHSFILVVVISPAGKFPEGRLKALNDLDWYEYWLVGSNYGLDMFFSLSGFLIALLIFKEWSRTSDLSLKRFYYRRFMRLMPVYLFMIIAVFIVLWIFNQPKRWYLITNVFYINNFFPHDANPMPWTWSLAVEEQFYFIFPVFLLLIKNRHFLKWMVTLFILSFFIRAYIVLNNETLNNSEFYEIIAYPEKYYEYLSVLYDNIYSRYGSFICGISAAYIYHYHLEAAKRFFLDTVIGKIISFVSVAIIFYILFAHNIYNSESGVSQFWRLIYYTFHRNVFSLTMTILMFLMLINAPMVSYITKFFSAKIWYPFAQLTYSAYLCHFIIIVMIAYIFESQLNMYYGDGIYWPLTTALSIILTYIISALLFYLIEAPFMRWRDAESGQSLRSTIKNKAA